MNVTTQAPVTLAQNVERSVYTALAAGAALLLADGAAGSFTNISVSDWKTALVAVAAGLLTGGKNIVLNYLSTHKSLKSQVLALQQLVNLSESAHAATTAPFISPPTAPPVV